MAHSSPPWVDLGVDFGKSHPSPGRYFGEGGNTPVGCLEAKQLDTGAPPGEIAKLRVGNKAADKALGKAVDIVGKIAPFLAFAPPISFPLPLPFVPIGVLGISLLLAPFLALGRIFPFPFSILGEGGTPPIFLGITPFPLTQLEPFSL